MRVAGTRQLMYFLCALLAIASGASVLIGCTSSSASRFEPGQAHATVVTTERAILTRTQPICCVLHTEDDDWCFLADYAYGNSAFIDISITTTLDVVIRIDSTVTQLTSLPGGWRADRKSKKEPWVLSELKEK